MQPYVSVLFEGKLALHRRVAELERLLDCDVLGIIGLIRPGMENLVRDALESIESTRKKRLAVVLSSTGGIVEVAERIVMAQRHFYDHVAFYVPDLALSAGTVLAMSGDQIWMDYSSCLGPIDPQVERQGKFVPALSYLSQYDRLIAKAQGGTLTDAEFMIMKGFDQAELHKFEMARELSVSLLRRWLTSYKFRDWSVTETSKSPVTPKMREQRAEDVATVLMDHQRWGSHGRGIDMKTLSAEVKLKIDDFGAVPNLSRALRDYVSLAFDYSAAGNLVSLVHMRDFL